MTTIPPAARLLNAQRAQPEFPDTLQLTAWIDPLVDDIGFPPHHAYVELLWLPIIGPSAMWIYRRVAELVRRRPGHAVIALTDLAVAVGLKTATGSASTLQKSLRRLLMFGLATWDGHRLAVRTALPPISRRHLQRLPADLQAVHHTLVAGASDPPPTDR